MLSKVKIDQNNLLLSIKLMDAEFKSLLKKEQGNFETISRYINNFIIQKKKNEIINQGIKIIEINKKILIFIEILKSLNILKEKSIQLSKGDTTGNDLEQSVIILCCLTEISLNQNLLKFKNSILKQLGGSKFSQLSDISKLPENLKIIFNNNNNSEIDIINNLSILLKNHLKDYSQFELLFNINQKIELIPLKEFEKKSLINEYPFLFSPQTLPQISKNRYNIIINFLKNL